MARKDGRKADEMRAVKMEVGVVKNADGSARVQTGETVAVATVYGQENSIQNTCRTLRRLFSGAFT